MDTNTLLGSAVIAAIISGIFSYWGLSKKGKLQYITEDRKEWREKIRKIASRIDGASYKKTLKILTDLKVRINAYGHNNVKVSYWADSHIWELIDEIEKSEASPEILKVQQKQLVEYISLLLKFDWERSKDEVKGNMFELVSWLILLCTMGYFYFSITLHNTLFESYRFEIISMIGIYILMIIGFYFIIVFEVKSTCTTLIKGVITQDPKKDNWKKLLGCYYIYIVSGILLIIIYHGMLDAAFGSIGNKAANEISIWLLTIMYFIVVCLQFGSQIKKIDNNYYYVDAVNRVRINYKSMKDTEEASEIEKCVRSNNDSKMTDRQDNRGKKRY